MVVFCRVQSRAGSKQCLATWTVSQVVIVTVVNMKLNPVVLASFPAVLAVTHYGLTDEIKADLEYDLKTELERGSRIDTVEIPYFNSSKVDLKPCVWSGSYSWSVTVSRHKACREVVYWTEKEFLHGTIEFKLTPEVHSDWRMWTEEEEHVFEMSKATAVLDYQAAGWGLQVNKNGSPFDNLFSRGERQVKNGTETKRFDHKQSFRCPPWHRCEAMTITWHAAVTGKCKKTPKYSCVRDKRICAEKREDIKCSAYQNLFDIHCRRLVADDCGFKIPLFDKAGNPITEVQLVGRDRRPFMTGCFKGYPWATLSNGEVYDPKEDMYFVDALGPTRWFRKKRGQPPAKIPNDFPCKMAPSREVKPDLNCTGMVCSQMKDKELMKTLAGGEGRVKLAEDLWG
ncbi:hypothetical protein CDD80_2170 [Ophiocordyceps camponoti-rufipedis]|uniref:Uncharacterized protein n=1 Tax=Ophiocordyceps camponoti-rufipedis TaxID=2004952 RepID=A0A2C5Z781_9HYPO|nr:hypothetical protein CDD80_2170 [Ophiocordyceps camponoti-rufipedis]